MPNFSRCQLAAAALIVAAALIGTGALVAKSGVFKQSQPSEIKLIEPNTPNAGSGVANDAQPTKLYVHVAGLVKKPGVYQLHPGARVFEAIKAAGGPSPNADLDSINLAARLSDGSQIYIAPKGCKPLPPVSTIQNGSESSQPKHSASDEKVEKLATPGSGKVNINTAGIDELQRLPGVGPATAQRIIEYRTQHGRFRSISELDEVKGIGPAKIEKMRPFISL